MMVNIDLLLDNFDPIEWLNSNGFDWKDSGKNISHGWIGLCCPFCGDDPSYHLGINLSNNRISCFRCNRGNGTVVKLVMKLHGVSFRGAVRIMEKYTSTSILQTPATQQKFEYTGAEISLRNFQDLSPLARKYLTTRNFCPEEIRRKYRIKDGGIIGEYAHRIIIPFFQNRKTVTFTARDYSETSEAKYKEMPTDECAIPSSHTLYNIDTVKDVAIVVEGPTDVWRIGDGCCAVTGIKYTNYQIKTLLRKNLRKIFVLFDFGAEEQAERFAYDIGSVFEGEVKILRLLKGDPAELSKEEVKELRIAVFGKQF